MIMLALGAISMVLIVAYYNFRHQKQFICVEKHNQLRTISELKINQLTQWYKERLSEVKFFSSNAPYALYVKEILQGNKTSVSKYREALLYIMSGNRYQNIILLSEKEELIYSTVEAENNTVDSAMKSLFEQVRLTRNIVVSDFYYCNTHQKVHIDFISPAFDENNVLIAFLVFRVEPDDYIFPLIRKWPIPSQTAETYIVRKDGDSVTFLSQLRYMEMDPLKMKLSLHEHKATAVRAVNGYEGIIEGIDYRGVKVLADIRKVPKTTWYMISEAYRREIYSDLYKHALHLAVIILISITLIVFITAWLYQYRQRNIYKELYQKQALLNIREEELRATLYSIGEGVIITDNNSCIVNLNPAAAIMTGWSEEAARNKNINEVVRIIDEESHRPIKNPVDEVLHEGRVVEYTDHAVLLTLDGKEVPISDNAAPIMDQQGKVLGVVLVFSNQTTQRARQKALEESEEKYRCIAENITDVVWMSDLNFATTYVSPSVKRIFGQSAEKHMQLSMEQKFPPDSLRIIEAVFTEELEKEKDPAVDKNRTRMFEVEHYRADGSKIWVGMNVSFSHDIQGNVMGFHGVTRDITEQKRVEKALHLSDMVFNLSLDMLSISGFDGFFKLLNPAWEKTLGWTLDELKAKPFNEFLHPDDVEATIQVFHEKAVIGKNLYQFENRYRCKNGTYKWLSWNAYPNVDQKAIFSVSRDITEERLAKNMLKESNQVLSRLISNLSGIAYRCQNTPEWTMEYISQGCIKISGYTDQDFYTNNITWNRLIQEEDRERVWAEISDSLRKQVPFEIEYQIRNRNGHRKWVWEKGCGVYGKKGEVIVVEGFITDVTERRETEDALKGSMSNYRQLIDGMSETVWVIDFDSTIIDVNKTATVNLGYSKEELMQIGLIGIDNSLTGEAIARLANRMPGDKLQIFETSHRSKAGKVFPVEVYSSIVTYQGKKAILSIARDITQRKQIIQDLIYAKEKAEESDRLKTAFLANVSHEIRTPMNGILGFLDLLRKPNLAEHQKEKFIEVVNYSGERLLETINKIVEVSKIESGQLDVYFEEVNIAEIMHHQHDFFKELAAEKGIDLILKEDDAVSSLKVISDRFKLEGIFTNLINNAIKFTQNGFIEFGVYREKDNLVFYVRDTGIGIPENKQEAVFDRFVQADLSLTRPYEGSGLGLSIAKAYVELIGGSIKVECS
jgi:PAS domain S-box-containing protein